MFTQITLGNILFYLSIFHLHPDCNSEYSVLPHIIPSNIIPWPSLFPQILFLSPDYRRQYFDSAQCILYSPMITLLNILSCPILFLQILFLCPDYWREYSDSAQYIQSSPKLNYGIFCFTPYYSFKYYSLAQIIGENIPS